jgi:hypothetical protein
MSPFRLLRVLPFVLIAGISVGCRSSTENEIQRERQVAVVQFFSDPVAVHVPETVAVGATFEVTVRTFGGGCVGEGDTEVSVTGRNAVVRPYDIFVTDLPSNYACTDDLRWYTHRATIRFAEAGPATVAFQGRVRPGDGSITIQRTVQVQ